MLDVCSAFLLLKHVATPFDINERCGIRHRHTVLYLWRSQTKPQINRNQFSLKLPTRFAPPQHCWMSSTYCAATRRLATLYEVRWTILSIQTQQHSQQQSPSHDMQSAKAPMGHVTSRSQSLALRSSCQAVTNLTGPVSQLAPHTLRLIRCHVAGHADAQQHASTSFLSPCPSVRLQRCHHSRSVRIQTGVFDKIRDILSGDSSGWAGPPEGRAEQAAAGGSAREEEDEGAELVKIDVEGRTGLGGTSEDAFGPLAVLLVGFMQSEVDAFRALMNEMDADIVKLIPCQHSMFDGSLLEAFNTDCPQYEQPPLGQRRALFMSGMYGSEVTELISAYRDAGLPPCVFAGLVPNNANRNVGELLEAVWRDHAAMQMAMAKLQQKESPDGEVEDSY